MAQSGKDREKEMSLIKEMIGFVSLHQCRINVPKWPMGKYWATLALGWDECVPGQRNDRYCDRERRLDEGNVFHWEIMNFLPSAELL